MQIAITGSEFFQNSSAAAKPCFLSLAFAVGAQQSHHPTGSTRFISIQLPFVIVTENVCHNNECLVVHRTVFLLPKEEEKEEGKK